MERSVPEHSTSGNIGLHNLGIDLSTLVQGLDKTASDIVENQRDSLVQRKELAQKTKDFRRLEDSAKLIEYKALLKGSMSLDYHHRLANFFA